MNEEIFVGDNGKLLINDFKPSYTITMNHSDGECVGRFDFNGPKLVFTGDAEESAKVFVNYLAMIWEKRLQEEREAEREKVAAWMRSKSYVTGHGDTTEDLLKELEWQVAEREREACARIADKCIEDSQKVTPESEQEENYMVAMRILSEEFAIAIRARGEA